MLTSLQNVLNDLPPWLKERALGLSLGQWFYLILVLLAGFLIRSAVQVLILKLNRHTARLDIQWKDHVLRCLEQPGSFLAANLFWYLALKSSRLSGGTAELLSFVINLSLSYAAIWTAYRMVDATLLFFKSLAQKTPSELDDQLVPILGKSLKVFVVVTGVLVTAQNLGFNVISLLTGLGLGGLAFALAAKDTAANLFGSIMILLDRPFKVGDWIVSGGVEGMVEEIGLRSTRIRTFYSSVISIPNSILANQNIDNMGQRKYRRLKQILGVTYDTPPDRMRDFINQIRQLLGAHPQVADESLQVAFRDYGDFNLQIIVNAFLKVADWGEELKVRQDILLNIYELAQTTGIEFAFPTQTLHVETTQSAPKHEAST